MARRRRRFFLNAISHCETQIQKAALATQKTVTLLAIPRSGPQLPASAPSYLGLILGLIHRKLGTENDSKMFGKKNGTFFGLRIPTRFLKRWGGRFFDVGVYTFEDGNHQKGEPRVKTKIRKSKVNCSIFMILSRFPHRFLEQGVYIF